MGGCKNRRFRDAMHCYELGLLEGDELVEFERHLFDCETCFNEVREFHRASQHLLRNREVSETVTAFVNETAEQSGMRDSVWKSRLGKRPLSLLIPAAAILVIALILKPWNIEFQPTREAVAAENRMLITCFEDLTESAESPQIGDVAASLLLVDLAESHYVQVVSRERLFNALRAMGLDGNCPPDRATAYEIALELGTRWLLTGAVVQRQPYLILTSELVDVPTGDVAATQRVIADPAENIFSVVDKLTIEVKRDLLLPSEAMSEFDPDLADITTDSPEAYSHYLDGVAYLSKMFYPEAIESFEAALRLDSAFAMVYYHLADLQDRRLINRALEHSADVSLKEKYYIESRAALYNDNLAYAIEWAEKLVELYPDEAGAYDLLGNYYYTQQRYEKAAEHYAMAAAEDPLFASPWNMLAYCHARLGNYRKAVNAVDKYIELARDEPNPYDSKAEILGLFGDLDAAIDVLEPVTEKETSFLEPLSRLGMLLMFRGEFQRADSCFQRLRDRVSDVRYWWVTIYRSCLLTREGRFDQAIAILDTVVTAYREGDVPYSPGVSATSIRASLLREIGEQDSALSSIEHTVRVGNEPYPDLAAGFQNNYVGLLVEVGDTATANDIIDDLEMFADQGRMERKCCLTSNGYLQFSLESYDSAAVCFGEVVGQLRDPLDINWFENMYMLALSQLRAGRREPAIEAFERLQVPYTYQRVLSPVYDVMSHYYLGIAYEQSGRRNDAILHFTTFLDLWGDADHGIPAVADARNRLQRLKSAS